MRRRYARAKSSELSFFFAGFFADFFADFLADFLADFFAGFFADFFRLFFLAAISTTLRGVPASKKEHMG